MLCEMRESQRESKTRTQPKTQERYFRDVNADPSTGQARRQREVGKESYGLGRFSCEQEKGAGECENEMSTPTVSVRTAEKPLPL